MQTQTATVVAISAGRLTLSVDPGVACARCAAGKGCGAGVFGKDGGPSVIELAAPTGVAFHEGDEVTLAMRSQDLLRASFCAYGVPLLAVVLVLAAARWIDSAIGDATAVGIALLAFVLAFGAARRWLRREGCMQRLLPSVAPMRGGDV